MLSHLLIIVICVTLKIGATEVVSPKKNVHIVVNSHLDLTWVTNFNIYYNGGASGFWEFVCAKCLFDDLFNILAENPNRTFTISELYFIFYYYDDVLLKDSEKLKKFFDFIKNKQLLLGQAGLSIQDQATTHYDDIIDQIIYGSRKSKELFNVTIDVGWALDTFGFSYTNTFILRKFGVKGYLIDRISKDDIEKRKKSKELDFFWGADSYITHILPYTYSAIRDSYKSKDELNELITQSFEVYPNPHDILIIFSDDFKRWSKTDYSIIETRMEFYNNHPELGIKMFYSSVSDYFDALNDGIKTYNISYPKQEAFTDFFPLVGPYEKPWVGYFSSRPNLKYLIRKFGILSRSIKNMLTILLRENQTKEIINETLLKSCVSEMKNTLDF